jgi:DNA polymerase-3 subunit delta'
VAGKPIEGEIKISQIRELISRLALKNFSAPLKAAIIDKAHLMNFQAQSCFLKTLEEPRGDTILILITEHPSLLLPTIVSRCQVIKFFPLREKEIEKELISKGAQREMAKELAELSLGRPGLAIDFLSDSKKFKEYKRIISDLIKIFNSDLSFRFQYVKGISQDSKEILKVWLFYLRKILRAKLMGKEDENSKNFSLSKLKNTIEFLERIIFLISTKNINQRLALENLMLAI